MFFECNHISFIYPGTTGDYVFKDLSFRVAEPGFYAVFGPSGVGKTSFAKIVSGDIEATSGSLHTENINNILYSYNLERLPGWSSVQNHIDKVTPLINNELKNDLVDVFGIREQMNARFSRLSLGQQNRVNLLRYLLQEFDLLIMDESLANVDEQTKEDIILRIKKIFPTGCFFYISHNVVEVSRFCKKIFVFRDIQKSPQVEMVEGLDYSAGQKLEKKDLETVMLEIMNAS